MTRQRLWFYVEFPRLALEAWFGPAIEAGPQLLLAPSSQRVLQCNPAAEQEGVRPGMSTGTAYYLLEDTAIAQYDAHLEQEQLQRLAVMLYRFCADIRLCPPAGLLLEIGSMLRLYEGLAPCLAQLENRLEQSGFSHQCATGHTPRAAQVLARNGGGRFSGDAAQIQAWLDPLPISRLGIETRDATRLRAMGLETYHQLRQAPRAELGYRFGHALVRYLTALEEPDTLGQGFTLPPRFSEHLELTHEAVHTASLLFPIKRLLLSLEDYLLARQHTVDSLHLRLEHREQPPTRVHVQAVKGAKTAQDWLNLVDLALERQQLPAPVIGLQLRADRFRPDQGLSGDLLGTAYPRADADRLLSLLISRLGHNSVLRPLTEPDPRPLQAGPLHPAAETGTDRAPNPARRQPVFLLNNPLRIDPSDYRLLEGPERITVGQWLQADGFRRDYFRAWQHQHQQLHWLARHANGGWYLEGVFG